MSTNILLSIIVTSLATYVSRFLGVLSSVKINETSKIFRWFNCLAYATLAALITRTIIFTVVVLRLIWKFFNSKPDSSDLPKFHRYASRLIQILLYALVVWIPIQGTMMTQAGGFDVKLLGLITIPKFIPTNFDMYPTFVQFHYQSMIALIIVFSIHLSAGLYHRFIKSDKYRVWNRMSFWGKD